MLMVGISSMGDEGRMKKYCGGKTRSRYPARNTKEILTHYYLYTITPKQVGRIERVIKKIADVGLKVHLQLLTNDENWTLFLGGGETKRCRPRKWTLCSTVPEDFNFLQVYHGDHCHRKDDEPYIRMGGVPVCY